MTVQKVWQNMTRKIRRAFSSGNGQRSALSDRTQGPEANEEARVPLEPGSLYIAEEQEPSTSQPDRPRVRRVEPVESLKQLPVKLEALSERLGRLDRLIDQLDALSGGETALPARVAQAMKEAGVGQAGEEILEPLRDLSSESRKQTDLLEDVNKQLIAGGEASAQLAMAIGRLADTGEAVRQAEAARTELMEQIRDHLANSNADLVECLGAQSRRMQRLGIAIVVALVAILGAVLAVGLIR